MDDIKDINAEREVRAEKAEVYEINLPLEEEDKPKEKNGLLKEIYDWVQSIALAVVVAVFINQFIFSFVVVEGESMLPTLRDNDKLVITKLMYTPQQGDIVVVKSKVLGKHIIKRVIAAPGDVLDLDPLTGSVTLNGQVLSEPYINEAMLDIGTVHDYPIEIPEGYAFVLGDNRNHSYDSRQLGLISFDDIMGKASLRVLPLSDFGTLNND